MEESETLGVLHALRGDAHIADAYQALAESGWIVHWAYADGSYMESLGGIEWHAAEPPTWDHQCAAQSRGRLGLTRIERCGCGAIRHGCGDWTQRNQTRIARGEQVPARHKRWMPRQLHVA